MRPASLLKVILPWVALVAACSPTPQPPQGLTVAVSIRPQAELVRILGGERWTVVTAVAPGQSPSTFDPSPRHMQELTAARVYFACGVPMENQLLPRLRSSYPELEIIDTSAGQQRIVLNDHLHGSAADGHDHGELDPHLWLDPTLMAGQAAVVAEAMGRLDPAGADLYRARCDSLTAEFTRLDHELREILAPVRGRVLFVFHPAYGYFARAYGLKQVAIEQGGIDPSPRHLAEVLGGIRTRGARAVFVQPQYSIGSARAIARETGVELVVLDPLAADYAENLRGMARVIREALDDR